MKIEPTPFALTVKRCAFCMYYLHFIIHLSFIAHKLNKQKYTKMRISFPNLGK